MFWFPGLGTPHHDKIYKNVLSTQGNICAIVRNKEMGVAFVKRSSSVEGMCGFKVECACMSWEIRPKTCLP